MYLKINEEPYYYAYNGKEIKIPYYVCLFDSNWKVVEEVWEYLQHRQEVKRLKFNTICNKGVDLKLYYDFLDAHNVTYSGMTEERMNQFIRWLNQANAKGTQRSAKTVNRILSTLRDFYRYHEHHYSIYNPFNESLEMLRYREKPRYKAPLYQPMQSFKIKEFDKGIRVLSKEQIETILAACTMERDRVLFELLLFTGIRIGEALSLTIDVIGVDDIHSEVQELNMSSNDNDVLKGNRHRQQKSGIRTLFIPSFVMRRLSSYYDRYWLPIYAKKEMQHSYLFISEFHQNRGDPLSYQAVWDRCRKIGKATGIYFTPHDFRHTYATILARHKIGIEKLKHLLGHRDLASTDIYIKIAKKETIVEELSSFYQHYGVVDG